MKGSLGTAFCNGVEDRHVNGLLRKEQLYREGQWQRIAWRLGWEVANMLTERRLRNAKAPKPAQKGSDAVKEKT